MSDEKNQPAPKDAKQDENTPPAKDDGYKFTDWASF